MIETVAGMWPIGTCGSCLFFVVVGVSFFFFLLKLWEFYLEVQLCG